MITADKIARLVASIVASTRYAHEAWATLEHTEKEKRIALWATFVRDDPEAAADLILANILADISLGEAWRKLHEIDGLPLQRPSIVHLVSLGKANM